MAERSLKKHYKDIYFKGGFDLFHAGHRTFIQDGINNASQVTSFDRVTVGLVDDADLRATKGSLSPLFTYEWRKDDVTRWFQSTEFGSITTVERAIPIVEQTRADRLIVRSSEYVDTPNTIQAQASGIDILFVPPSKKIHTSDIKSSLVLAEEGSHCQIRQVGAVLLRDGVMQQVGSNGGGPDSCFSCPKYVDIVKSEEITGERGRSSVPCVFPHAEVQVLESAQKGDDLLVTTAPCDPCAEQIVEKGINRVVFLKPYHGNAPYDFLKENGVKVRQAGYQAEN